MNLVIAFLLLLQFFGLSCVNGGKLILMDANTTQSFDNEEALFSPSLKGKVMLGVLFEAKPLDACQKLNKKPDNTVNATSPFVLIIRGNCSFDHKVRNAQRAGFKAAIVYDNKDSNVLVPMKGDYTGDLKILAVFVTKRSGETLKNYIGVPDFEVLLVNDSDNLLWSFVATLIILLTILSCIAAICIFTCGRTGTNAVTTQASVVSELGGMSPRLVNAMKSLFFSSAKKDDKSTDLSCCICFEDYIVGDKLRVLPCEHKFHASCVDFWLTTKKTFCPMCKRDARMSSVEPPATENTPLLSPTSSFEVLSGSSTEIMSSFVYFSAPHESSSSAQRSFRSTSPYRSSNVHVSRSSEDIRQEDSPLQLTSSQRSDSSWTSSSSLPESAQTFFSPLASTHSLPDLSLDSLNLS